MVPYLSKLCETLATSMIGDNRPISLKVLVEEGTLLIEVVSAGGKTQIQRFTVTVEKPPVGQGI